MVDEQPIQTQVSVADAEADFIGSGETSSRVFVCSIYSDQRPLKGVAGALDWRLKGFLSRFVINGRIEGRKNELVYVPVKHRETMRHLLLIGLGPYASAQTPNTEFLASLQNTVTNLKFDRVAVSRSSFPLLSEATVRKALKGVQVEFTR